MPSSSSQSTHQKSQIQTVLKVTPPKSGRITSFVKKESMLSKKKILRENVTTALINPHKKIRVSNSNSSNNAISSSNSEKESSNCYVNDSELPCCSRSTTSFIYKPPSSPSGSSSSSTGQVKITSFMPIKKVGVVKYNTNGSGSAKPSTNLKKSRSMMMEQQNAADNSAPTFHSLSEKLLKKKKRLLKTETTTLKRKKSRPQKPLV